MRIKRQRTISGVELDFAHLPRSRLYFAPGAGDRRAARERRAGRSRQALVVAVVR